MTLVNVAGQTVDPSLLERKIIHFDMDAFYAAIEVRDDPKLAGKPLIVGGSPNSRGVVCTASYEARKYGIRSAMACAQAARLCPNAIFLRPNFEKYKAASMQIREIFQKYTDRIEPLSLDEAYLDVTNNARGWFAVKIARALQEEILESTGLSGSAGVAPNKLLAKIASDIRKPRGLTVVLPAQALEFMRPLPLRKINGIGPVTEKRLAQAQLHVCEDVWAYSLPDLQEKIGSLAEWLYQRSRGLDSRPVEPHWNRKSLGREETFDRDLSAKDVARMHAELHSLAQSVGRGLQQRNLSGKTVTLKVRYGDFSRSTRSRTLDQASSDPDRIFSTALELLRATEAGERPIRLLGISLSNLEAANLETPILETQVGSLMDED